MRKFLFVLSLAALGCLSQAQVRGSDLLANYASALERLQSVSATFTLTPVLGLPTEFKVDLARPNRARLESSTMLVVADGQSIYTYNKKRNAFYRRPETEEGLNSLFTGASVQFLAPYFKPDAFAAVYNARSVGEVDRKGAKLNSVVFATDDTQARQWTLFFTPEDSMIRQGRYVTKDDSGEITSILHITNWVTDQTAPETFAWSSPAGAKEVSGETIESGAWFTSWDDAKLAAELSQRTLVLVFGSKSNGPTQQAVRMIERNRQVRSVASSLVFCRLNIEEAPALATSMRVGPLPTIRFFRWDGAYLAGANGPSNERTFLPLLAKALARAK